MENLNAEKIRDEDDGFTTKNFGCFIMKLKFLNCFVGSKCKVFGSAATSDDGSTKSSPSKMEEELKISSRLRRFSWKDMKVATNDFRPEGRIGHGGFGSVFKARISENRASPVKRGEGGLVVAIKSLNRAGLQGHKEWLAEVKYLGNLSHPNLVTLVGYCIEGDKRALVYEYMRRGSLENQLFKRRVPLPWSIRMKVALGTAKGLAFLHEESEKPVIFRDIKASNILLDADYNPKLSDFGLAKDGPKEGQTHVTTRVMGTFGYAAPEYVMTGHLTAKSDVYSFGVVLLEIITGRRAVDENRPNREDNLLEWAKPYLANPRRFYRAIDYRLEGQFSIIGAQTTVQLAARCLSRDPKARPLMTEVVELLNPLPDLNDMAYLVYSFKTMQENYHSRASPSPRHSPSPQHVPSPRRIPSPRPVPSPLHVPSPLQVASPRHGQAVGITPRNNGKGPAVRSPSIPKVSQASPYHHRQAPAV